MVVASFGFSVGVFSVIPPQLKEGDNEEDPSVGFAPI